jgi:hypothetical protein
MASEAICDSSILSRRTNLIRIRKSVIGWHERTDKVEQLAHNLGKKLAKVAKITVFGGLSGTIKVVY